MKYRMLSKEQFEELHEEFALFLASQEIDQTEWKDIKANRPKVAQQEMEVFSDMVWDRVLENAIFLDHIGLNSLNLFKRDEEDFHRILLQVNRNDFDLSKEDDFKWLMDNIKSEEVTIYKAKKKFEGEFKQEFFSLIEKGAVLSKGDLYLALSDYI